MALAMGGCQIGTIVTELAQYVPELTGIKGRSKYMVRTVVGLLPAQLRASVKFA